MLAAATRWSDSDLVEALRVYGGDRRALPREWVERFQAEVRSRAIGPVMAFARRTSRVGSFTQDDAVQLIMARLCEPKMREYVLSGSSTWATLADAGRHWYEAAELDGLEQPRHQSREHGYVTVESYDADDVAHPAGRLLSRSAEDIVIERATDLLEQIAAKTKVALLERTYLPALHHAVWHLVRWAVWNPASESHEADARTAIKRHIEGVSDDQVQAVLEAALGARGRRALTSLVGGYLKDPTFDPEESRPHRSALLAFEERINELVTATPSR